MYKLVDPETEGVHPLRLKLSDDDMYDIIEGIQENKDWMTLEELEAATDYLFDYVVAQKQTVPGTTVLQ